MNSNAAMTTSTRVGLESGCPLFPLPTCGASDAGAASADWASRALVAAAIAPGSLCRNDCLEEDPERWDGLS